MTNVTYVSQLLFIIVLTSSLNWTFPNFSWMTSDWSREKMVKKRISFSILYDYLVNILKFQDIFLNKNVKVYVNIKVLFFNSSPIILRWTA